VHERRPDEDKKHPSCNSNRAQSGPPYKMSQEPSAEMMEAPIRRIDQHWYRPCLWESKACRRWLYSSVHWRGSWTALHRSFSYLSLNLGNGNQTCWAWIVFATV